MKKYTANEIATILEATDNIFSISEPNKKELFDKINSFMELLMTILPDGMGAYKEIYCGNSVLKKTLIEYNSYKGRAEAEFNFSWFQSPYYTTDTKEKCISNELEDKRIPKLWYDILEHKDEIIAQAIAIRQQIAGNKAHRIYVAKYC